MTNKKEKQTDKNSECESQYESLSMFVLRKIIFKPSESLDVHLMTNELFIITVFRIIIKLFSLSRFDILPGSFIIVL